jgi:hypothetical protein
MNTYTMRVQEQHKNEETGRWECTGQIVKATVAARNVDLAVFCALRQARSQGLKHPKVISGPESLPSQANLRQIIPPAVLCPPELWFPRNRPEGFYS